MVPQAQWFILFLRMKPNYKFLSGTSHILGFCRQTIFPVMGVWFHSTVFTFTPITISASGYGSSSPHHKAVT